MRLLRALIQELHVHPHELVRLAFDDVRLSHNGPRRKDTAKAGAAGATGGEGRVLVEFGFVASMLPMLLSELVCPQNQDDECMRISLLVNGSLVSEGTGGGGGGQEGAHQSVTPRAVYSVMKNCGLYLRGVVSAWLEVGREHKVELLMQSRDGHVIPVGGGGTVVHLHVFAQKLRRVGAWGVGGQGGGGEGSRSVNTDGKVGGTDEGRGREGRGDEEEKRFVHSERDERGEREGGQEEKDVCGVRCQSLMAWRKKMQRSLPK